MDDIQKESETASTMAMRVGEEADHRDGGQHNTTWRGHRAATGRTQVGRDSP